METDLLDGTIVTRPQPLQIINAYKPPSLKFKDATVPQLQHRCVLAGNFNAHSIEWGYREDGEEGEHLSDWSTSNDLHLLYDPKEPPSFLSTRWRIGSNPDLVFYSATMLSAPQRRVLGKVRKSQHRPSPTLLAAITPAVETIQAPRWNFRKANWQQFRDEVDEKIPNLRQVTRENLDLACAKFVSAIISSAKKNIPRGFRKCYIPCWDKECNRLLTEVRKSPEETTQEKSE